MKEGDPLGSQCVQVLRGSLVCAAPGVRPAATLQTLGDRRRRLPKPPATIH